MKAEWDTSKNIIMKNLIIGKFKEHSDLAILRKNIIAHNHNDLYWESCLTIGKDNFVKSN